MAPVKPGSGARSFDFRRVVAGMVPYLCLSSNRNVFAIVVVCDTGWEQCGRVLVDPGKEGKTVGDGPSCRSFEGDHT